MLSVHHNYCVAQLVKNLPVMRETWVRSLGREDPWRRNGNPLQYSCLENARDRGAWWAAVYVKALWWLISLRMFFLLWPCRQPWDPRSEKGGLGIKSWPCSVAVGDGLQSPRSRTSASKKQSISSGTPVVWPQSQWLGGWSPPRGALLHARRGASVGETAA